MSAGRYDLKVDQGATFRRLITWTDDTGAPVPLVGWTAEAQVRTSPSDAAVVTLRDGDGITLGGEFGTIDLVMTPAQTAAMLPRKHVWDLLLTAPTGQVTRLLQGEVRIDAAVTR